MTTADGLELFRTARAACAWRALTVSTCRRSNRSGDRLRTGRWGAPPRTPFSLVLGPVPRVLFGRVPVVSSPPGVAHLAAADQIITPDEHPTSFLFLAVSPRTTKVLSAVRVIIYRSPFKTSTRKRSSSSSSSSHRLVFTVATISYQASRLVVVDWMERFTFYARAGPADVIRFKSFKSLRKLNFSRRSKNVKAIETENY